MINFKKHKPFLILDLDSKHCIVGKERQRMRTGFNGSIQGYNLMDTK